MSEGSATTTACIPRARTCSSRPAEREAAIAEFRAAAACTTNLRERHFLTVRAARLARG